MSTLCTHYVYIMYTLCIHYVYTMYTLCIHYVYVPIYLDRYIFESIYIYTHIVCMYILCHRAQGIYSVQLCPSGHTLLVSATSSQQGPQPSPPALRAPRRAGDSGAAHVIGITSTTGPPPWQEPVLLKMTCAPCSS